MRQQIFQGILPVKPSQIPTDLIAGITLATLSIPEVMGYTKIAEIRLRILARRCDLSSQF